MFLYWSHCIYFFKLTFINKFLFLLLDFSDEYPGSRRWQSDLRVLRTLGDEPAWYRQGQVGQLSHFILNILAVVIWQADSRCKQPLEGKLSSIGSANSTAFIWLFKISTNNFRCVRSVINDARQEWEVTTCEALLPFMCEIRACPSGSKHCSNGKCVNSKFLCDGQVNPF